MSEVTTNAIITSANIQLDRGCFLCAWVHLDYGDGSHQGFGGHALGGTPVCAAGKHKKQPNYAAEALVSIMRVGGVEKFSDLAGKAIRVRRTSDGFGGDIIAIGHIIKDIWYDPKKQFKELKP